MEGLTSETCRGSKWSPPVKVTIMTNLQSKILASWTAHQAQGRGMETFGPGCDVCPMHQGYCKDSPHHEGDPNHSITIITVQRTCNPKSKAAQRRCSQLWQLDFENRDDCGLQRLRYGFWGGKDSPATCYISSSRRHPGPCFIRLEALEAIFKDPGGDEFQVLVTSSGFHKEEPCCGKVIWASLAAGFLSLVAHVAAELPRPEQHSSEWDAARCRAETETETMRRQKLGIDEKNGKRGTPGGWQLEESLEVMFYWSPHADWLIWPTAFWLPIHEGIHLCHIWNGASKHPKLLLSDRRAIIEEVRTLQRIHAHTWFLLQAPQMKTESGKRMPTYTKSINYTINVSRFAMTTCSAALSILLQGAPSELVASPRTQMSAPLIKAAGPSPVVARTRFAQCDLIAASRCPW